jgi:hypothetical protein
MEQGTTASQMGKTWTKPGPVLYFFTFLSAAFMG